MNHSYRALLLRVMLSALIFIDVKPATGDFCSYKTKAGYCIMENVTIQTDAEAANFVFPNEKQIGLIAPNLLYSWKILFSRLPSVVEKLGILDGFVPEVRISSTLYDFRAQKNLVRDVIIDEPDTYSLKYLTITQNPLRYVPTNLSRLINLEKLYLHDNEIETVKMDQFKELTRLEYLTLNRNRITRVDTEVALILPNLAEVYLQSNYIEHLSIKQWNFPSLKIIQLHNNRLRMIQSFPEQFPNLNQTSISYNRWSCTWLDQTIKTKAWLKIFVIKESELCSEKSLDGICCEESLADVKRFLVSLQRAIEQIDEKISKLTNSPSQMKQGIEIF